MSSISRAQSWPLLVPASAPDPKPFVRPKTPIETRRFLRRHYYPEGGWGWVVLVASTLVQVLTHGLQLSAGVVLVPTAVRFKVPVQDSGTSN